MVYPYTLGVVVIMKNEAPYVKEWLDYHLNAGVDIVYLYDNDSTDNLEELVSPYIVKGLVVYHKFPGDYRQLPCYHDALTKYRFSCKYLAFIDADEFIYPTNNGSIKEFAENYFSDKENIGGLIIPWYLFGSNGEEKADFSRGVLERFQRRGAKVEESCKSLVNPRLTYGVLNTPHQFLFFNGISHRDENGNPYLEDESKSLGEKIFIAHYGVKSKEEYLKRVAQGDAFYKKRDVMVKDGLVDPVDYNYKNKNEVEDGRVYNYYLKNLNTPHPRNNIADCLLNAADFLNNDDIKMEDYLSAFHILCAGGNLLSKESVEEVNLRLNKAFNIVTQKNLKIHEVELFMQDVPFLLQQGMNRDIVLKLAKQFYDWLEQIYLANKAFTKAALLRINKKWFDIL